MKAFYNLGIILFTAVIRLAAPFNIRARQWVAGRKGWHRSLEDQIDRRGRYIWIHCASLGEFEQGRPVIEAIKKQVPGHGIVLTFFSPSGYEVRKNYPGADIIAYLPADTPRNAERFISLVNPVLVIFVKYEFWYNYINKLQKKNIPLLLISAIFRPSQHFFRWYGTLFRQMLKGFTHIFVQDSNSEVLLKGIGVNKITIAGDTRFDRVAEITKAAGEIRELEIFRGGEKLFLAGSSWQQDEEIIADYINVHPEKMKWVFAPHEIDKQNIARLERLFRVDTVRFSRVGEAPEARVLILDNMGMLSSAYRYACIAAVGGGFGRGIHNVLEPACWGIPVMFGPNYGNFREAVDLIKAGGAKSFKSLNEFTDIIEKWLNDDAFYLKSAQSAGRYVGENTGATAEIMRKINQQVINIPVS